MNHYWSPRITWVEIMSDAKFVCSQISIWVYSYGCYSFSLIFTIESQFSFTRRNRHTHIFFWLSCLTVICAKKHYSFINYMYDFTHWCYIFLWTSVCWLYHIFCLRLIFGLCLCLRPFPFTFMSWIYAFFVNNFCYPRIASILFAIC